MPSALRSSGDSLRTGRRRRGQGRRGADGDLARHDGRRRADAGGRRAHRERPAAPRPGDAPVRRVAQPQVDRPRPRGQPLECEPGVRQARRRRPDHPWGRGARPSQRGHLADGGRPWPGRRADAGAGRAAGPGRSPTCRPPTSDDWSRACPPFSLRWTRPAWGSCCLPKARPCCPDPLLASAHPISVKYLIRSLHRPARRTTVECVPRGSMSRSYSRGKRVVTALVVALAAGGAVVGQAEQRRCGDARAGPDDRRPPACRDVPLGARHGARRHRRHRRHRQQPGRQATTPTGRSIWSVGTHGAGTNQFDNPRDVGVDAGQQRLRRRHPQQPDREAVAHAAPGSARPPVRAPAFSFPLGVSAKGNKVYVGDTGRHRVVVLDQSPERHADDRRERRLRQHQRQP